MGSNEAQRILETVRSEIAAMEESVRSASSHLERLEQDWRRAVWRIASGHSAGNDVCSDELRQEIVKLRAGLDVVGQRSGAVASRLNDIRTRLHEHGSSPDIS